MKNIFREIKYAYQRVVRYYDDRIFWEFDSYFYSFLPAIKKFCQDELKDVGIMENNPKRKEVFTHTLELAEKLEKMPPEHFFDCPNEETDFWEYFGKNITIYWN